MSIIFSVEILLEDILRFHELLEASDIPVEQGVRDMSLLESAVNAPFQTFGGDELFPTVQEKAARLLYGIANNHAFIDGNKRTAVHAMEMYLLLNNVPLDCNDDELEAIVIAVADNTCPYDEIVRWIRKHT